MEKFIPYEKLSKKKKRELNESRRTRWTIPTRFRSVLTPHFTPD